MAATGHACDPEWRVMDFAYRGAVAGIAGEVSTVSDPAIAAVTSLPLAVTVDSASPHETKLVDETLAGSLLDQLPARLSGDSRV